MARSGPRLGASARPSILPLEVVQHMGAGQVGFEQGVITLEPGSALTLFSDGVTEAVNEKDDMFEEERLAELLL